MLQRGRSPAGALRCLRSAGVWKAISEQRLGNYWCRRGESNPRPRDYETLALPLSYAGTKTILNATESVANVSSIPMVAPAIIRNAWGYRT
jgi:hypothetical protein